MSWTARPSMAAGEYPGADDFEAILDQIDTLTVGAWTDYASTLAITATVTPPTKGDSVYTAEYQQIGKIVVYTFRITVGSTWASGSGSYRYSLPVTADAGLRGIGSAWINDSGTALRTGVVRMVTTTTCEIYYNSGAAVASALGSAGSGTAWATSDAIEGSITYEAA